MESKSGRGSQMRVLVACEYSGRVRQAFRKLGHDAWSCDLLDADDGSEYHIKGDCVPVIEQGWDIIIMHPPCTALTVAGNSTYGEGNPKYSERLASVKWTVELWNLAIRHARVGVAMENPVGVLPRLGGGFDRRSMFSRGCSATWSRRKPGYGCTACRCWLRRIMFTMR